MEKAFVYYRTSSRTNVGDDKDSLPRQQEAVRRYAEKHGIQIIRDGDFYDAGVSGVDEIVGRKGFAELLDAIASNGVRLVLVEDASRLARTLLVQEQGIVTLISKGVRVVTSSGEDLTQTDDDMRTAMRQMVGVFAQLEKARLVRKLKRGRDKKREETGRCEGRKPPPPETIALARRLAVPVPNHKRMGLRKIAEVLAEQGHTVIVNGEPTGNPYSHEAVRQMMERKQVIPSKVQEKADMILDKVKGVTDINSITLEPCAYGSDYALRFKTIHPVFEIGLTIGLRGGGPKSSGGCYNVGQIKADTHGIRGKINIALSEIPGCNATLAQILRGDTA